MSANPRASRDLRSVRRRHEQPSGAERARVVERAGGGIVITESELTPERLGHAIEQIINDPERTRRMGKKQQNAGPRRKQRQKDRRFNRSIQIN